MKEQYHYLLMHFKVLTGFQSLQELNTLTTRLHTEHHY